MENHNPSLTASVTGSQGQSSAPTHRPLASSGTASSSSSPPRSSSAPPIRRRHSSSIARDDNAIGDSERRPEIHSQRTREQSSENPLPRPQGTLSRVHLYPDRFATIRRGDIVFDESGLPRPNPRRGHRRRSTHVTPADLESFRREVLGIESTPSIVPEEETQSRPRQNPSLDPQFEQLNQAFESANMSLNSGSSPSSGMFSGYVENPSNVGNGPRQSVSGGMPHAAGQVNGGAMPGMNGGLPMNAGHQMDLQQLYDMVLELSDVLKNNRDMTKNIVTSAEDLMNRAATEGTTPSIQQVSTEISAARIAELERALAKEKRTVEILKHEQDENARLIGEYEAAVGTMVEQIRNYCQNNNLHFLAQKRQYNNLLQAERDAHLESRLDRDYWHAQTMRCSEMIRTAYRLRCEEEEVPIRVVAGLQNEVRAYRDALGMEPEKPEEEYGWEILKDVPPSVE
ncbi:uncharacterized protein EURHEDRAFT_380208 [Aspergillus ruber CBS 135680]|uniref:Uncharacterized protein n=1 Tax=Aspergillus ruber (strain CBS 135680) TaxID=1388766 RepID=A0A017S610_ASPRC|nr:uncharacterized protein EURHEDRAFT_380208 [Aspergillus ruber CBS 135680]EYE92407.1 hypothetical protein EURHEDRAFT_380208 [Aspergillus ruber CBS 135680]